MASTLADLFTVYRVYGAGLGSTLVNVATCALSIGLSYLPVHPYVPGVIYGTLGITMALNGTYFGRQVTKELERQRGSRDVRSPSRG